MSRFVIVRTTYEYIRFVVVINNTFVNIKLAEDIKFTSNILRTSGTKPVPLISIFCFIIVYTLPLKHIKHIIGLNSESRRFTSIANLNSYNSYSKPLGFSIDLI